MQNRRDNPEPGAPPIDFPGITVLQYAGDGMFSLEEDFWSLPEGIETVEALRGRVQAVRSRTSGQAHARNWGTVPSGRGRVHVRREPGARVKSHA